LTINFEKQVNYPKQEKYLCKRLPANTNTFSKKKLLKINFAIKKIVGYLPPENLLLILNLKRYASKD